MNYIVLLNNNDIMYHILMAEFKCLKLIDELNPLYFRFICFYIRIMYDFYPFQKVVLIARNSTSTVAADFAICIVPPQLVSPKLCHSNKH